MKLAKLEEANQAAIDTASVFRNLTPPEAKGKIDQRFHQHKNKNPYFGYIRIEIGSAEFSMFSANDDLVAMTFFWYGADSYEPMSLQLWSDIARTAQTVLDVGAFSGVYGLTAAILNPLSKVYAIEAARRTYGRLLVNVQTNRLTGRIDCTNVAVSSGEGTETFLRFKGENILGIGDSFIEKRHDPQDHGEQVRTISLDQFCREREIEPDLIKIDVEGAECLALAGMSHILSQVRPRILIEVTPKTSTPVADELSKHGYSVHVVNERDRTLTPFVEQVTSVLNLWAVPT